MENHCASAFAPRLWVYTNFDCNLQCSYCCARSSPRAERRSLALPQFKRLIDEAADCGISELFLTGGEPFLLPDLAERILWSVEKLQTTVLTNAMLFRGTRLAALQSLAGRPVRFQVSLDGPSPEAHDPIRGAGSFDRAVEGIGILRRLGFTVLISTTVTPGNADLECETRAFVRGLGISQESHFFRPLAMRGFSTSGMEVSAADLEPEVTVSKDGVFWHPLACEDDFLVTRRVFPLADALAVVHSRYHSVIESGALPRPFK